MSCAIYIFCFLTCSHKGTGEKIRTNNLYFIKYSSQLIELPFRNKSCYIKKEEEDIFINLSQENLILNRCHFSIGRIPNFIMKLGNPYPYHLSEVHE
jgi:hypothetical protein